MIVTITSTMPAKTGGFVWFPFDVPNIPDIDTLFEELRSGGIIRGDRIDTAVISGFRRVTRRTPYILGVGMVGSITPLHADIISETGEALE